MATETDIDKINIDIGKINIFTGPTASGKSEIAHNLAKKTGGVIINSDSMQVYKEIPILTAQPAALQQEEPEYRLYGVVSVKEHWSAGRWLEEAVKEINNVKKSGRPVFIVGGGGMYLKILVYGVADIPEINSATKQKTEHLMQELGVEKFHEMLKIRDPDIAARLKPADTQRLLRAYEVIEQTGVSLNEWQKNPPKQYFSKEDFDIYLVKPDRKTLYENINKRFITMLENGAIDEVKAVMAMNLDPKLPSYKAHGLRELIAYIKGDITKEEMVESSQQQVRNYAKRQYTWFRHQMPEITIIQ